MGAMGQPAGTKGWNADRTNLSASPSYLFLMVKPMPGSCKLGRYISAYFARKADKPPQEVTLRVTFETPTSALRLTTVLHSLARAWYHVSGVFCARFLHIFVR